MIDIKAIREAAEAATPGPWHYGTFHKLLITDADNYKHYPIAQIEGATLPWDSTEESERAYKNATHIATANPATVIALCDEIESLREQIGAYQLHEKQLLAAKQGLECGVAPELKEAVERLLSWERSGRQTRSEDIAFAQQALAKAEGGAT